MMPGAIYFIQECPTCGRRLQINVEYLGRRLACDHCHGRFVACDPDSKPAGAPLGYDLLRRADELLASLDRQRLHHS